MKKLIIISIIALYALTGYSQTNVRMKSETVGFWTLDGDTMQIVKADAVVIGSVYVPSYSADSVTISGCTFEIDGITTNGIKIAPGEVAVKFGFDYAVSDTITIAAPDLGWVMLLIDRN
jgi:hypothetical protein